MSSAAILKACKAGKYRYIEDAKPTGGKQVLIYVSSLESEIQEKILSVTAETMKKTNLTESNHSFLAGAVTPFSPPLSLSETSYEVQQAVIPDKAKQTALAKVDLLNYWERYRKGKSKAEADKDFIEFYNCGALNQSLLSVLGEVTIKSLYRWKKELAENNNDPTALIPKYNYSSDMQVNTQMSDIEKKIFLELMLKNNKIKVGKAYEFVKYRLSELGITTMSSYSTYRRVWQHMNKKHHTEVVFAREGGKAAKETMPSILRKPDVFEVGDVLIADGNVVDFDMINPYTGKAQRMTLIAFIDWASWDIIGWEIMPTENTQAIASAFRNAVMRLGKMPKVVYLDNGKAFRGKFFSGCDSFCSAQMDGLYKSLGIKVKYTEAYNGRAKIIERFFKEFTESFAIVQNSYRGNSIANKPAYLMRNEKFHLALKGDMQPPSVQEFKQSFEDWLNNIYRQRKSKSAEHLTIAEHFAAQKGPGVDEEILNDFIMARDVRTVTKEGIRMFNTLYWCDALLGIKDRVVVKYSLFDLTKLKVFSMKGVYLGTAATRTLVHGMAAELGDEIDYTTFKAELKAQKDRQKAKLAGVKAWLSKDLKKARVIKAERIITRDILEIPVQNTLKITDISIYDNLEMPKIIEK